MSPNRILVRATNWVGDALMTTPALAALGAAFPRAGIFVLAKPLVAPVFEGLPEVAEVIRYEPKKGMGRLKSFREMAARLRRGGFDWGLSFQNAFEAALLFQQAGIGRRIGYATDARKWLLTDPLPIPPHRLHTHQVRYYLGLLEDLGLPAPESPLRFPVTPRDKEEATQILKDVGIGLGGPFLAINPGATYGSAKRWYPERFAQAADLLAGDGLKVVLTGSPSEVPIAKEIASRAACHPAVLSGRTTLRQLAGVLSFATILLSNDSGTMHVGAAVGVPTVALFGSTDRVTTAPWMVPHRIVHHPVSCGPCLLRECPIDHRCMEAIGVEEVVVAARKLLEK